MDAIKQLKELLPKDEVRRLQKSVQHLADKHVNSIDNLLSAKVRALESS